MYLNTYYIEFLTNGNKKKVRVNKIILNNNFSNVVIIFNEVNEHFIVGFSKIVKIQDSLDQILYEK